MQRAGARSPRSASSGRERRQRPSRVAEQVVGAGVVGEQRADHAADRPADAAEGRPARGRAHLQRDRGLQASTSTRQDLADRTADHRVGELVHLGGLGVHDHDPRARALGDRHDRRDRDTPTGCCRSRAAGRSSRAARLGARAGRRATRFWPNEIVADFRIPPQLRQGGSSSPARTRASARSIGARSPQSRHVDFAHVPWISTSRSGDDARRLVQPVDVLGDQRVQAAATLEPHQRAVTLVRLRLPGGRLEPVAPGAPPHLGLGDVVRAASPSSPRPGSWSTRPCGPRKSGMPDSVEMPGAGQHHDPLGLAQPAGDLPQVVVASLMKAFSHALARGARLLLRCAACARTRRRITLRSSRLGTSTARVDARWSCASRSRPASSSSCGAARWCTRRGSSALAGGAPADAPGRGGPVPRLGARTAPADWVNHSCEPNCGLSGQIALVALRRLEPGEEVCFDYAMSDGSPYDQFHVRLRRGRRVAAGSPARTGAGPSSGSATAATSRPTCSGASTPSWRPSGVCGLIASGGREARRQGRRT